MVVQQIFPEIAQQQVIAISAVPNTAVANGSTLQAGLGNPHYISSCCSFLGTYDIYRLYLKKDQRLKKESIPRFYLSSIINRPRTTQTRNTISKLNL